MLLSYMPNSQIFTFTLRHGLTNMMFRLEVWPRLALNVRSSCLSLPKIIDDTSLHHPAFLKLSLNSSWKADCIA